MFTDQTQDMIDQTINRAEQESFENSNTSQTYADTLLYQQRESKSFGSNANQHRNSKSFGANSAGSKPRHPLQSESSLSNFENSAADLDGVRLQIREIEESACQISIEQVAPPIKK
jgi:hypothetical protein